MDSQDYNFIYYTIYRFFFLDSFDLCRLAQLFLYKHRRFGAVELFLPKLTPWTENILLFINSDPKSIQLTRFLPQMDFF